MNLSKKIALAKQNKEKVNCISTALYIVGAIPKDVAIDIGPRANVESYLSDIILEEPEVGCLIAVRGLLEADGIVHMGVVIKLDPYLMMVHRIRADGEVKEEDLEQFFREKYIDSKKEYRRAIKQNIYK